MKKCEIKGKRRKVDFILLPINLLLLCFSVAESQTQLSAFYFDQTSLCHYWLQPVFGCIYQEGFRDPPFDRAGQPPPQSPHLLSCAKLGFLTLDSEISGDLRVKFGQPGFGKGKISSQYNVIESIPQSSHFFIGELISLIWRSGI